MEEYNIKWKDHTEEAFRVLNQLRSRDRFADVLLFSDNGIFKAHKVILASCSSYFEKLFTKMPVSSSRETVVALRDVESSMIELILDFIYVGEVQVPHNDFDEFMKISEWLGIRGLGTGSNKDSGRQSTNRSVENRLKEGTDAVKRKADSDSGSQSPAAKKTNLRNFGLAGGITIEASSRKKASATSGSNHEVSSLLINSR
jgi:hypothetical protein